MKNNVTLTICRHGSYGSKRLFPIDDYAMCLSYAIGFYLQRKIGKIDAIYTSTLERAAFTGLVLAKSSKLSEDLIFADIRLHEDANLQKINNLIEEVKRDAKEKNLSHVLLVTHLPVFWELGYTEGSRIKTNHCSVFSSDDWSNLDVDAQSSEEEIYDYELPSYVISAAEYLNANKTDTNDLRVITSEMAEYFDKNHPEI